MSAFAYAQTYTYIYNIYLRASLLTTQQRRHSSFWVAHQRKLAARFGHFFCLNITKSFVAQAHPHIYSCLYIFMFVCMLQQAQVHNRVTDGNKLLLGK